jgi:hypothetical protein
MVSETKALTCKYFFLLERDGSAMIVLKKDYAEFFFETL